MDEAPVAGLRERKRVEQRHRLADAAARLFAEHGYDAVAVVDIARAANVSEQTVYNYFPTKPDLVLDRADEIREQYRHAVEHRGADSTPSDALRVLVHADIARYAAADLAIAGGEFPALCVQSAVLRRFALEVREQQVDAVAGAITAASPQVHPLIARAHAASLIAIVQAITDQIGRAILDRADPRRAAAVMRADADAAFTDAAAHFRAITTMRGTDVVATRFTDLDSGPPTRRASQSTTT